jgi:hypothetical protein
MRLTPPRRLPTAWALGAIALGALPLSSSLRAADHADAPLTTKDASADITDVYAWHDDTSLTVAFGFAGLSEAGAPAQYDAGVLYTVHIDNNGDDAPDHDVLVRFGQNGAGEWGVRVQDLPGVADPVIGPVETTIEADLGLRVFAGLRDDAFFFDLDGFRATLMTGELMFDATNDTFAGTNITAVVLEMSIDAVAGGSDEVSVWVSTGRREG